MYCKNCGKQLKDTAKFCNGCGKEVQSPAATSPEVKSVAPNLAVSNKAPKGKKPIFTWAIVMVALIIAAIVGVPYIQDYLATDVNNTLPTTPAATSPSHEPIVGTWVYQSETAIYSIDFAVLYKVSTFELNRDGTCSYTFTPVILREPTETIADAERIKLLDKYPLHYPGMAVPEEESGEGTFTYLGKGSYFEKDQVGMATLLLTTTSSQYEYYNSIVLRDDKLFFKSTEFTKEQ